MQSTARQDQFTLVKKLKFRFGRVPEMAKSGSQTTKCILYCYIAEGRL